MLIKEEKKKNGESTWTVEYQKHLDQIISFQFHSEKPAEALADALVKCASIQIAMIRPFS